MSVLRTLAATIWIALAGSKVRIAYFDDVNGLFRRDVNNFGTATLVFGIMLHHIHISQSEWGQVSEYEVEADALFRLLFGNESGKSRFIPLLFKLCNRGCDVAPVVGRNFGVPEFVENGSEVVKRRDPGADAVVFPGNIFAG